MKININEIYKRNIALKYDFRNDNEYKKKYNNKERHMWEFTLVLLQVMPNRHIYNNENKNDLSDLNGNAILFFDWSKPNDFTINEWFDYLKDK